MAVSTVYIGTITELTMGIGQNSGTYKKLEKLENRVDTHIQNISNFFYHTDYTR